MLRLTGGGNSLSGTLTSWGPLTKPTPSRNTTSLSQIREGTTQVGSSKRKTSPKPPVSLQPSLLNFGITGRRAALRAPPPLPRQSFLLQDLESPRQTIEDISRCWDLLGGEGVDFFAFQEVGGLKELACLGWDQDEVRLGATSYVTFMSFPLKSFHGTVIGLPLEALPK